MEVQNKPLPVKIWTSSHGLASHYFPQSLEKVFKENNEIELPSINAKGGRTFSDDLVATYKSEFDKIKDKLLVLARSRPEDKYALVTGLK